LDRVVGVGALVDGLGVAAVARRPAHDERALGPEPAADVLEDEEVAVLGQLAQVVGERTAAERVGPVRGAQEEERQWPLRARPGGRTADGPACPPETTSLAAAGKGKKRRRAASRACGKIVKWGRFFERGSYNGGVGRACARPEDSERDCRFCALPFSLL